jgi:hypothetical protein
MKRGQRVLNTHSSSGLKKIKGVYLDLLKGNYVGPAEQKKEGQAKA